MFNQYKSNPLVFHPASVTTILKTFYITFVLYNLLVSHHWQTLQSALENITLSLTT